MIASDPVSRDRRLAPGVTLACLRRTMCWKGRHLDHDDTLYIEPGDVATVIGSVRMVTDSTNVLGVALLVRNACVYELLGYITGHNHTFWKLLT